MLTRLGSYQLNQPVGDVPDLIEFDSEQYALFEMAGVKRLLRDERIYNGHDINFLDSVWNTVIGASEDKIYKVSIQNMNLDKAAAAALFRATLTHLRQQMGRFTRHPWFSSRYIWDDIEGNVLLNQVNKMGMTSINLFLTSSAIRSQAGAQL
ncbi:MAG TPA: hypothetical protein VN380_18205 [Thermoanaerobaculia bacterium]|jgi:hypothetical protein|nr:hypothetical protein [Thermoanaerobaculia bacterium]